MQTVVTSPTKTVTIGDENPFCIIGERINPTGRRIFQEQVRAGDLSAIIKDVKAQVDGGADMLDVFQKRFRRLVFEFCGISSPCKAFASRDGVSNFT